MRTKTAQKYKKIDTFYTFAKNTSYMTYLSIFASGAGSNAQNIINFYKKSTDVKIVAIYTNRADAGVINIAQTEKITVFVLSKEQTRDGSYLLNHLKAQKTDFIVLAGYLALIPAEIITAFAKRIINIHPSLLPKFGGKGMYGMRVHQAVVANHEETSGITIHLIDEEYDKGETLFQTSCRLSPLDTPEDVALKIHDLEYQYFPKVIDLWIQKTLSPSCEARYDHL